MIEMKCTKRQKAIIIESLINPNGCLWPQKQMFCIYDPKASCKNCFEKNIKWIHMKAEKGGGEDA